LGSSLYVFPNTNQVLSCEKSNLFVRCSLSHQQPNQIWIFWDVLYLYTY
jgi:hypothetical protein